jgi:hypothetical protein
MARNSSMMPAFRTGSRRTMLSPPALQLIFNPLDEGRTHLCRPAVSGLEQ